MAELKGTTASPDDRQRMLEVLQRMHDDASQASSDSDEDGDAGSEGPLSRETLDKLQLQVGMLYCRCSAVRCF